MKARKIVRNRRKMDEKGVSPVIGVILMVAATIVIAAVVMGMLGGFGPPSKAYTINVQASRVDADSDGHVDDIRVTYMGGPDAALLDAISGVTIDGTSQTISASGFGSVNGNSTDTVIGAYDDFEGNFTGGNRVIVTATFVDGSVQIVLDTYV